MSTTSRPEVSEKNFDKVMELSKLKPIRKVSFDTALSVVLEALSQEKRYGI